jgi:polyprenyl-phospho-N-acetylgalactosaminyl synthase
MQSDKQVFIIIPAYNEGKVLRHTIQPLLKTGYQIVIVDDGSMDGTHAHVSDLPIHYIRHPINMGQGAALQTGATYAIQENADYIIHFDADGQHSFAEIPTLLQPLIDGECDIVLGSRFLRKDDVKAIPFVRRGILKVAVLVNAAFTGMMLTDAHNGFRAMNRKAFSTIRLTENRMAHASQILTLIKKSKLRYKEVPVHIVYTEYSTGKGQTSFDAINIFIDLIINKIF